MSGAAASDRAAGSVTLRATFGAVQAADDGVAAMTSQDSDGSELEKGTSKGCFVAKSYQSDSSY